MTQGSSTIKCFSGFGGCPRQCIDHGESFGGGILHEGGLMSHVHSHILTGRPSMCHLTSRWPCSRHGRAGMGLICPATPGGYPHSPVLCSRGGLGAVACISHGAAQEGSVGPFSGCMVAALLPGGC